jgi:hypothetical protein
VEISGLAIRANAQDRTAAHDAARMALAVEKIRVIVITRAEVDTWADSSDIIDLFKRKRIDICVTDQTSKSPAKTPMSLVGAAVRDLSPVNGPRPWQSNAVSAEFPDKSKMTVAVSRRFLPIGTTTALKSVAAIVR